MPSFGLVWVSCNTTSSYPRTFKCEFGVAGRREVLLLLLMKFALQKPNPQASARNPKTLTQHPQAENRPHVLFSIEAREVGFRV